MKRFAVLFACPLGLVSVGSRLAAAFRLGLTRTEHDLFLAALKGQLASVFAARVENSSFFSAVKRLAVSEDVLKAQ